MRLSDSTRDASQRVAVSAEGDGIADRVFERSGFQEADDRLRNRVLARLVELIGRSDFVDAQGQVIGESFRSVFLDVCFRGTCSRKKNSGCGCLRAFETFRVVVRYVCEFSGSLQNFIERVICKSNWADSHCGPVAPAVVRLGIGSRRPMMETEPVACVWIAAIVGPHQ